MCTCDLIDNQLNEIRLMKSMYPNEIDFEDQRMKELINLDSNQVHLKHHFHPLQLVFNSNQFKIYFTLDQEYPSVAKIRAYLRLIDTSLSSLAFKRLQLQANQGLSDYINKEDEVNIFSIILWAQEWIENNLVETVIDNQETSKDTPKVRCRFWIYSHHIYTTSKRRLIQQEAKNFNLNGFLRSGKPGFICVEGEINDCKQFWQSVKTANFQKIVLIEEEHIEDAIFSRFEELILNNVDFIQFLKDKKCSAIIIDYLGLGSKEEQ